MGMVTKLAILLLGLLFVLLAAQHIPDAIPASAPTATAVEIPDPAAQTKPAESPAAATTTTASQSASIATSSQKAVAFTQESKPAPPPLSPQDILAEKLSAELRAASVSILCNIRSRRTSTLTGGSGIIVDSRGIILTNAHVAQYFLLRDYPSKSATTCEVRTGNPAGSAGTYKAELLYLPPAWIAANAVQIAEDEPTGTGEYDFALLRISAAEDGGAMPAAFPFLTTDKTSVQKGEVLFLASYPVGASLREQILESLYLGSSYGAVKDRYVFDEDYTWIDAFSVAGVFLSEAGSSGGAAARIESGGLAGIIVTETGASAAIDRSLRAITVAHIDRALQQFGMGGIATLLTGDLTTKAAAFNKNVAPGLTEQLISALKNS